MSRHPRTAGTDNPPRSPLRRYDATGASVDCPGVEAGSIAVDPSGFLYVTISGGTVEKYTAGNSFVTSFTVVGEEIAADADGNVYTVDRIKVRKYAPTTQTPVARMSFGQLRARWAR